MKKARIMIAFILLFSFANFNQGVYAQPYEHDLTGYILIGKVTVPGLSTGSVKFSVYYSFDSHMYTTIAELVMPDGLPGVFFTDGTMTAGTGGIHISSYNVNWFSGAGSGVFYLPNGYYNYNTP